jgi:hypothetical protein
MTPQPAAPQIESAHLIRGGEGTLGGQPTAGLILRRWDDALAGLR